MVFHWEGGKKNNIQVTNAARVPNEFADFIFRVSLISTNKNIIEVIIML